MPTSQHLRVKVVDEEISEHQLQQLMTEVSILIIKKVPPFVLKVLPNTFGKPLVVFCNRDLTTKLRTVLVAKSERLIALNYLYFVISPHLEIPIILVYLEKAFKGLEILDSGSTDRTVSVAVRSRSYFGLRRDNHVE